MAVVNGATLAVKVMVNEGIEKAFVLSGGHVQPIFYAMRDAGIEVIDVRHECAAVYAAIGYTRASGKMAAVVTTAGPGVANTATGMLEAESLSIPLLHIGGAVYTWTRDGGDLQDIDTLGLMASCCRWAKKVMHTRRIPEYVSTAIRHALDGTPGPVYLEIPTDLVYGEVDDEKINFRENSRAVVAAGGDPQLIEEAAELLASAERPALLVDDSARWSMGDHASAVAELSDYLKVPVGIIGGACRGLFGDELENPLLCTNAMARADVVLSLGCRFDFRAGNGRAIPADAKVIQVHADSRMIGYNLRADVGIVGGAGVVVKQVLESVKSKRNPKADKSWCETPKLGAANLPAHFSSGKTPIHPARSAGDAARFLEEDASDWNIIVDGGEAGVWIGNAALARRPGQIHGSGSNGTIGMGPCQVIGAWVANRKPVLWYTGDGSFGFYAMEMDTMERLGIPVVCIISNDSGWGMISLAEELINAEEVAEKGHANVKLADRRAYEKMATMWDGHAEMVTDPDEILPAIRRAAANGKPSIVNVIVDNESKTGAIAGYASFVRASVGSSR